MIGTSRVLRTGAYDSVSERGRPCALAALPSNLPAAEAEERFGSPSGAGTTGESTYPPFAIGLAQELARRSGGGDPCRFNVFELDNGLSRGQRVDLLFCHPFVDRRLDDAIVERLAPIKPGEGVARILARRSA